MMIMDRFTREGRQIFDKYPNEALCVVEYEQDGKDLVNLLNEFENKNRELTDKLVELQESLSDSEDKYEAIVKLIESRITENQQLAYLHYPEPEDEYINEYDSRADELAKLKDLIING